MLASAKGLAVLTVLKAGFLGSGRLGSGVLVARLPDGQWSAPSAIMLAGGGVGAQIGFELTDFVFLLDADGVRSFAQAGSLALGGNLSLAAGPVGRNLEATVVASREGIAYVYSYSKTKGVNVGISIEGYVIFERRSANEEVYGRGRARTLVQGVESVSPAADPLMRVLHSPPLAATGFRYDASIRTGASTSEDSED